MRVDPSLEDLPVDNLWIWLVAAVVVIAAIVGIAFGVRASRSKSAVEAPAEEPQVEAPKRAEPEAEASKPAGPTIETPEPVEGRLVRLRSRLARSNNALGKGLLALLASDKLDDDVWDEIEATLLTADVGMADTTAVVERLRERVKVLGTRNPEELRGLLKAELTAVLEPELDRSIATVSPSGEGPAVIMMVGVNGSGKTTTCGRVARVLIAEGQTVLMGAADTFRAAAAEQLETWGSRVGATVVRRGEGADPASVAFDAVKAGAEQGADVVLIDTAGRLQNKAGLMDELGKVKRVIEKQGPVAETLLVLDATTGQNGLQQAKVFGEVCDVSGIVLTKLDGSAKGGIVIAVQRQLGVPVKLVGLGEGPDDLAPFEVGAFVDAIVDGAES
ncbi:MULTISPECIES: signal recognition particle-docking protein FtsY [Glycomyces]|uniref:Signal recognition particle receptor FtsY n=1 Tax=Glycomyces lechevalierae TaxID=256034 RepID=A0A9X3T856_9ACTN|nr:signal recognition particle-docking protein FtsY [Glycomyces lechevalierae]MDA1384913.1 signal recognition particle-docking protein FtsY [Glycomyces lechevalierae]MDR7337635.1 fused signal recognition particle receptor [Glycomyces lechevalierae]